MKYLMFVALIALSNMTYAESTSLKAGLWEMKIVSQVVDGRDMAVQMSAAKDKMQQAMANMPPEKRKQMEAMMGGQGMSIQSPGNMRICVSAEMAARDKPMVDPEGRCEPAKVSHGGNKTTYEFNCSTNGGTMVGKGESTLSGDTMTSRSDMTMTDARGRHTMQSESQMKYLGADCKGIKPIDQLTKASQQGLSR